MPTQPKSTQQKQNLTTTNISGDALAQVASALNIQNPKIANPKELEATENAKALMAECISPSLQQSLATDSTHAPPSNKTHQENAGPEQEAPEPVRPGKLFITGRVGAGILPLLASLSDSTKLLSLDQTVRDTLVATARLKGEPSQIILEEFRNFGDGKYSPTLTNILFLGLIRRSWADFGSRAFWARAALADRTDEIQDPAPVPSQLIVIGIRTSDEFKFLKDGGFTHYHVMCSPATALSRSKGRTEVNSLAIALDNDVQKQISLHRQGPRLNVIWHDDTPAPAPSRFMSVQEFREKVVGSAPGTVVKSYADLDINVI